MNIRKNDIPIGNGNYIRKIPNTTNEYKLIPSTSYLKFYIKNVNNDQYPSVETDGLNLISGHSFVNTPTGKWEVSLISKNKNNVILTLDYI